MLFDRQIQFDLLRNCHHFFNVAYRDFVWKKKHSHDIEFSEMWKNIYEHIRNDNSHLGDMISLKR